MRKQKLFTKSRVGTRTFSAGSNKGNLLTDFNKEEEEEEREGKEIKYLVNIVP